MEKTDHAGRVLEIMGSFGADTRRYAVHHPWAERLARDADIGAARQAGDMRLSVFHYPLEGWVDAVVMNVLMGRAGVIQLKELARVSYQPLAEVFRAILPREARHAELGAAGLARIAESDAGAQGRAGIARLLAVRVLRRASVCPARPASRCLPVSASAILPTRRCSPNGRRQSMRSLPR